MLTPIFDHAARARARLAQQYKDKPKLAGLLDAFSAQTQALEDALWQLATELTLDEAVGAQLDRIGALLDEGRAAYSDEEYRTVLRAKIKVMLSSGATEELLAIYHALEPALQIAVTPDYPAGFVLELAGGTITATNAPLYRRFLRLARAGGVRGVLQWQESADAGSLILSDAANYPESSTTQGLGDATDSTTGGYLSGAGE